MRAADIRQEAGEAAYGCPEVLDGLGRDGLPQEDQDVVAPPQPDTLSFLPVWRGALILFLLRGGPSERDL